jgi:hypothetical protein
MNWRATDLVEAIVSNLTYWPQGRPLGFSIPQALNFIGYNLGGLPAIYFAGAAIVTINAFLFYLVLKSIGSKAIAVLAAVTFCLFPADTTRSFLTHLTVLQISLTFFLVATLLYISGRTILSYIVITGALLTYESGFVIFFGVPLLIRPWNRRWAKSFLKHATVLVIIMIADYILRRLLGDSRVEMGSEPIFLPLKIVGGMVIGPTVSLAQFLLAPIRIFDNLDFTTILAAILSFGLFAAVFANLSAQIESQIVASPAPVTSQSEAKRNFHWGFRFFAAIETMLHNAEDWFATIRPSLITKGLNHDFVEYCAKTVRYPVIGAFWLVISYGLSFTQFHFPPIVQFGRLTSTHLAAAFGASILVGWILSVVLFTARNSGATRVAVAGLALYFALLVGYGVVIQKNFQLSWKYQRSFWTNVLNLAPDLTDGTIIFVPRDGLPETSYILTHSWADPIVLGQIFHFPREWKQVPRLFVIDGNWIDLVRGSGNGLEWSVPMATWPSHQEDLPDSNVILLKAAGGGLTREHGHVEIQGKSLNLKTAKHGARLQFEKRPLYDLLIDESKLSGP